MNLNGGCAVLDGKSVDEIGWIVQVVQMSSIVFKLVLKKLWTVPMYINPYQYILGV